jgi:hypothetical protein
MFSAIFVHTSIKEAIKGMSSRNQFQLQRREIFLDSNVYRPCPGKPIALFNDIPFYRLRGVLSSFCCLFSVYGTLNSKQEEAREPGRSSENAEAERKGGQLDFGECYLRILKISIS